jgi:aryl-alcohol dehydrogenase-like predicted oxidoreductase
MRLSTGEPLAEDDALATIAAAADAGITVFDTARAYGENEALLARALRTCGADERARVVTKGGMTNAGGAWVPDGRAKAIRADCEASLAALDGLPIDLYLLHAPDPRTPWRTSVRALVGLVDDGLVRRIGLSNVNRRQLDEALEWAPVAAVQVALSPFDDRALRGGVVDRCAAAGIAVMAHSPLGGPGRAVRIGRVEELARVAEASSATPAEVALAWLLGLSPVLIPIPGARRPETARSAARAAGLDLDAVAAAELTHAFGRPLVEPPQLRAGSEVVIVMGIPGAGKSHVADEYVERGYVRLNRDERGGTLRALLLPLEEELASPAARIVLDNTYLTRASRSYVLDAARAGAGESDRAPARPARTLARPGRAARAGEARAGRARTDLADACRARARAARDRRGIRRRRAARVQPGAAQSGSGRCVRRCLGGAGDRLDRRGERSAPRVRLASRRQWRRARGRGRTCRRARYGACRRGSVPSSGRPAEVLVPAAASRPDPRVRTSARNRLVAVDARRHEPRAPDARHDSRRAVHRCLTVRVQDSSLRERRRS